MTTEAAADTRFRLTEAAARTLVGAHGTPLYVVDETHFRDRIRRFRRALADSWPETEVSFASKANSALALLKIAWLEGCKIDVASEGELRAAIAAGVPAEDCHLHGSNKSADEILYAIQSGVGLIVADHFGEIEGLASVFRGGREIKGTRVVLRLAPGVDPVTHSKISTGQADTKFGFNIADGSAEKALARAMELRLPVIGFHCHVGSQLLDSSAQRAGAEALGAFAVEMKRNHGFEAKYINAGGGLGVRYSQRDEPVPIERYCAEVAQALRDALAGCGMQPTLGMEPGRALIAESGVTLYTVGVLKTVPVPPDRERTYVSVDGGLADNPRPALYNAHYTVERLGIGCYEKRLVTITGRHCESDNLFEDVELPSNLGPGDVLQVLATGAYNASMASTYNRYPRPACVLLRPNGTASRIQRRETWEEMLERESVPEDL